MRENEGPYFKGGEDQSRNLFEFRFIMHVTRWEEVQSKVAEFIEIKRRLDAWAANGGIQGGFYSNASSELSSTEHRVERNEGAFRASILLLIESRLTPYRSVITRYEERPGSFEFLVTGIILNGLVQYADLRESLNQLSKDVEGLIDAVFDAQVHTKAKVEIRPSILLSEFARDLARTNYSGDQMVVNDNQAVLSRIEALEKSIKRRFIIAGCIVAVMSIVGLNAYHFLKDKTTEETKAPLANPVLSVVSEPTSTCRHEIDLELLRRENIELKIENTKLLYTGKKR